MVNPMTNKINSLDVECELSSDSSDGDVLVGDVSGRPTALQSRTHRLKTIIDPSFEPKILRKNKSITRAESTGSLANESKVLVLFSGGTIGMMKNHKGGLCT
ncbi:unnamed protein product, partial [Medioppia subpectinata]